MAKKDNKAAAPRSRYSIFQIAALLMHAAMIFMFLWMGVISMAVGGIFSVISYIICGILIKYERYMAMNILFFTEVVIHNTAATVLTGWDTGFSLYFLTCVPIVFYFQFPMNMEASYSFRSRGNSISVVMGILSLLLFIALRLITYFTEPMYAIVPAKALTSYLINSAFVFVFLVICSTAFMKELDYSRSKMSQKLESLNRAAGIDALTGLYNRRSFDKIVCDTVAAGSKFCFIMCDIDDFKKVNDTYGHDCGDAVLKNVAAVVKGTLREHDYVCRWGGEEILILVTGVYVSSASNIAERIRSMVEESVVKHDGQSVKCTLTLGVAQHDYKNSYEETINIADKLLYEGKSSGKNKVVSQKSQMDSI
ncbi:MAG: GGDEF domain-containing protein [Oscillospiraceae bacterium]|nr:GGDEF domain-containing protein [Oscillospiraceae bacterium]